MFPQRLTLFLFIQRPWNLEIIVSVVTEEKYFHTPADILLDSQKYSRVFKAFVWTNQFDSVEALLIVMFAH